MGLSRSLREPATRLPKDLRVELTKEQNDRGGLKTSIKSKRREKRREKSKKGRREARRRAESKTKTTVNLDGKNTKKRPRKNDTEKVTELPANFDDPDEIQAKRLEKLLRGKAKNSSGDGDPLDIDLGFDDDGLGSLLKSLPQLNNTSHEGPAEQHHDSGLSDSFESEASGSSRDMEQNTLSLAMDQSSSLKLESEKGMYKTSPSDQASRGGQPQDLRRKLKGLLNRLGDHNVISISDTVCDLMRDGGLSYDAFSDTVLEAVKESAIGIAGLSPYIPSFAALSGALCASQTPQFERRFLADLAGRLISSLAMNSKDALGYSAFLAELYKLGVVGAQAPYDLIRRLVDVLSEYSVEVLLLLVRRAGPMLRRDDPKALKQVVTLIRAKVREKKEELVSTRLEIMLDLLADVKNNCRKQSEEPKFDWLHARRRNCGTANVTLDVLLNDKDLVADPFEVTKESHIQAEKEQNLVRLAGTQKMNTEFRKTIFLLVMSSTDVGDACDRILSLNLKDKQNRDVVRVLFQCCAQESTFNPFYGLVMSKLCRANTSYTVSAQYAVWDFLGDLHGNNERISDVKATNLAGLVHKLLSSGGFDLKVLRGCKDLSSCSDREFAFLQKCLFGPTISGESAVDSICQLRKAIPCEEEFTKVRFGFASFLLELASRVSSARARRDIGSFAEEIKHAPSSSTGHDI